MQKLMKLLIILSLAGLICAVSKSVSVYDKNTGQLVTSSSLVWDSYNPSDSKQLSDSVVGGTVLGEDKYDTNVCRTSVDGVYVSGYTRKKDDRYVCIVSMHDQVRTKQEFDVLLNKEQGAKLSWTDWDKFKGLQFTGSISTINGGSNDRYYIARHKLNHTFEAHDMDYVVGRFDPSLSLGRIVVSAGNTEKSFEDGQILVEIVPTKYEISEVLFDKFKIKISRNRTMLGQSTLKNEDEHDSDIDVAIGYNYDTRRNFGSHAGIARGVESILYEGKDTRDFLWGIWTPMKHINTKSVGTRMPAGTAMNVTLWGNYTTIEGPFSAKLKTFWSDNSKPTTRLIKVIEGLSADMEDLDFEYSSLYWLHNNTVVPTTTTTMRTTSTSTKNVLSSSVPNDFIAKMTEKSSTERNKEKEHTSGADQVHLTTVALFVSAILFKIIY